MVPRNLSGLRQRPGFASASSRRASSQAEQCDAMCGAAKIVTNPEESKRLNRRAGPMILIAGTGMGTGGRGGAPRQVFAPDEPKPCYSRGSGRRHARCHDGVAPRR